MSENKNGNTGKRKKNAGRRRQDANRNGNNINRRTNNADVTERDDKEQWDEAVVTEQEAEDEQWEAEEEIEQEADEQWEAEEEPEQEAEEEIEQEADEQWEAEEEPEQEADEQWDDEEEPEQEAEDEQWDDEDEPEQDTDKQRYDTDVRKRAIERQQQDTIEQMNRAKRQKRRKAKSRARRRKLLVLRLLAVLSACVLLIFAAKGIVKLLGDDQEYSGNEEIVQREDIESWSEAQEGGEDTETEEDEEPEEDHVFTVCIDPGHGGKDIGANSGDRLEKDDVLRLGIALRDYLESQGVNVVMTRDTDDFLKLSARCKIANKAKADYLISLHRNTGKGNGVETWILTTADEETKIYAEAILASLDAVGISRNRGVKQGTLEGGDTDYSINLNSNMPSCIVELGFLNSSQDNDLLDSKLEAYAEGIGKAITESYQVCQAEKEAADDSALEASSLDETVDDEAAAPTAEGDNAETPAGSTDAKGNVTSIALINEPIDEQAQDTTPLDWGQGKNFDELNRPGGCLMYQQKYGDLSAYFLGPWDEGEQKVIYLTFDIGYTNEYTISILDTLKKKDVKAVFFATYPVFEEEPAIVKRIINEGHELANHSVTHPSAGLPSETVEEQRAEIMDVHNICLEKYGYTMHLFRFPAGKFSAQSLAIANNCNYRSVFWSWAHMDWNTENQPDVQTSLNTAVERLHPGAIYLLHGISSTNAEMLGDLIDAAREQGYEFALLQ